MESVRLYNPTTQPIEVNTDVLVLLTTVGCGGWTVRPPACAEEPQHLTQAEQADPGSRETQSKPLPISGPHNEGSALHDHRGPSEL